MSILEKASLNPPRPMNKERWSAIMRVAGMSEQDMRDWHCEFEKREPDGHQQFLESLNLEPEEIESIRNGPGN